ncbi:MAG: glycosyltransferase family 39 protein [Vicinamibacteria bacterium]|nr:glycosyltransferase family 39 protein [Vicinamibacteria bacterium]
MNEKAENKRRHWERLIFAAVLLLAGFFRFYGIDHDLRRAGAEFDEAHNFVSPILRMWNDRSFDPQVYSGYAGAFNYLAFAPVIAGHALGGEVGAFVAARALVAVFGTGCVALLFLLARREFGLTPALVAAILLTFSRIDVRSTHYVVPDVVVGFMGLVLLLIARRSRPGRRAAAGMGAVTGLATAMKYSGVILGPAGALALLARRETRRGLWPFVLCAALAFAVAAPYAILGTSDQGAGVRHALHHYYGAKTAESFSLAAALDLMRLSLGLPAIILAAVGAIIGAPRSVTLPAAALAVTLLVFIAPSGLLFPRHVVPALAPAVLLAVAALHRMIAWVPRPYRTASWLVAAVIVLWRPIPDGWAFFSKYLMTPAPDRAAAWIEESFPEPRSVLASTSFRFPLDVARFEVVHVERLDEVSPLAVPHFDLVVASPAETGLDFESRWGWPSRLFEERHDRRSVLVFSRPTRQEDPCREAHRPDSLRSADASENANLVWDGDRSTQWRAFDGAWIEAEWREPLRIAKVTIVAGDFPHGWPQRYRILGRGPASDGWDTLGVQWLRPIRPAKQRPDLPRGQEVVLTPPRELFALRILRDRAGAWSVAEMSACLDPSEESVANRRAPR